MGAFSIPAALADMEAELCNCQPQWVCTASPGRCRIIESIKEQAKSFSLNKALRVHWDLLCKLAQSSFSLLLGTLLTVLLLS